MQWEYDVHLDQLQRSCLRGVQVETILRGVSSGSGKWVVKHSCVHPIEPWVVWCSSQGVIQLWDHHRRVCLKAFHLSTLDQLAGQSLNPPSSWKVRKVLFLDGASLLHQFYPGPPGPPSLRVSAQRLLVVLPSRLYFYDYLQDKCQAVLEKGVRQAVPIDETYLALGYSDGQLRILDTTSYRTVKTFRGYHQKPLSFLCAYKQNQNQRARLLGASKDGLIGCWNADTDGIAFKFLQGKQNKVLSGAYSPLEYRLLTLTEDSLTLWSALSGQQLQVFKNLHYIRQVVQWGHHSFQEGLLVHTSKAQVLVLTIPPLSPSSTYSLSHLLDLRSDQSLDPGITILDIAVSPLQPHLLSLSTSQGLLLLSLNHACPLRSLLFHPSFTTNLSLDEAKSLITNQKVQPLSRVQQAHLLQLDQTPDLNNHLMFLSVQHNGIFVHLLDLCQLSIHPQHTPSEEQAKVLVHPLKNNMPWQHSHLQCSHSGKYISIWNRMSGYYQVLYVNNNALFKDQSALLSSEPLETLHFCSSFSVVAQGISSQGVQWHLSQEHFAVLQPLDKQGQPVRLTEQTSSIKHKAGMFKTHLSHQYQLGLSGPVASHRLLVFQLISSVELIQQLQSIPLSSPVSRLYAGHCFIVSCSLTPQQKEQHKEHPGLSTLSCLSFYCYDDIAKKYCAQEQIMSEPLWMEWSAQGDVLACVYAHQLVLYRNQQNGLHQFYRLESAVQSLLFFESLLFYATSSTIGLLVLSDSLPTLDITLATLQPPLSTLDLLTYSVSQEQKLSGPSSLLPRSQLRPPGQIYLQSVYDQQLVVLDSHRRVHRVSLTHPFLQFLLFLQFQDSACLDYANKLDTKHHPLIKDYLVSYQMDYSSLLGLSVLHQHHPCPAQVTQFMSTCSPEQAHVLLDHLLLHDDNDALMACVYGLAHHHPQLSESLLDQLTPRLPPHVYDSWVDHLNSLQTDPALLRINPFSSQQPPNLDALVQARLHALLSI